MPFIIQDKELTPQEKARNAKKLEIFLEHLLPAPKDPKDDSDVNRKKRDALKKLHTHFILSLASDKHLLLENMTINTNPDNSPLLKLFQPVRKLDTEHLEKLLEHLEKSSKIAPLTDKDIYLFILRFPARIQHDPLPSGLQIDQKIEDILLKSLRLKDDEKRKELAKNSVIDTLVTHGYVPTNYSFFSTEIQTALKDYTVEHKDIPAKVLIEDLLLFKDPATLAKDIVDADDSFIRTAIKAEQEIIEDTSPKKARSILMPINNGTGHFVFLKITININGSVETKITDSMSKERVSPQHIEANQWIIKNIHRIANPGKVFAENEIDLDQAIDYTGMQSDTQATCPFYAAREVVKAFDDAKKSNQVETYSNPDRLDLLANAARQPSITKFQKVMLKKLINDPQNAGKVKGFKNKSGVLEFKIDGEGVVYLPSKRTEYDKYKAFRQESSPPTPSTQPPTVAAAVTTTTTTTNNAEYAVEKIVPPALKSSLNTEESSDEDEDQAPTSPTPPNSPTQETPSPTVPIQPPVTPIAAAETPETPNTHYTNLTLTELIDAYITEKKAAADLKDGDVEIALPEEEKQVSNLEKITSAILAINNESKSEGLYSALDINSENIAHQLKTFLELTKEDLNPQLHEIANQLNHDYIFKPIDSVLALGETADELINRIAINSHYRSQLKDLIEILQLGLEKNLGTKKCKRLLEYTREMNDAYKPMEAIQKSKAFKIITEAKAGLSEIEENIQEKISFLLSYEQDNTLRKEIDIKITKLNLLSLKLFNCISSIDNATLESNEESTNSADLQRIFFTGIPTSLESKPESEQKVAATIQYLIIMTRRSIFENPPTRKYLDKLYKNTEAREFIAEQKDESFKKTLADLENQLTETRANIILSDNLDKWNEIITLSTAEKRRLALKKYINEQSLLLQQELANLNDNPEAQVKCIEHWINILDIALNKVDVKVFPTALIIYNALSADQNSPLNQTWLQNSISPNLLTIFKTDIDIIKSKQLEDHTFDIISDNAAKKLPEEESQQKRMNARADLHGVIKEIYENDLAFAKDMSKLKKHFEDLTLPFSKYENVYHESAVNFANSLQGCTTTPFAEAKYLPTRIKDAKDAEDLEDIVANLGNVIQILQSEAFKRGLEARERGTINLVWSQKFQADLVREHKNKQYDHIQRNPANSLVSNELIKPTQQNPRYILLIKEMIKQIEKLEALYKEDTNKDIQIQIAQLKYAKSFLDYQLSNINKQILALNARVAQASANRKIFYALSKHLSHKQMNEMKMDLSILERTSNPPTFNEVYPVLRKAPLGIKQKQKYIIEASLTERARLERELKTLDPSKPDYKLKKLNYEIKIQLLLSMKGLGLSTQDKVHEILKLPTTTPALELMAQLDILDQTRIEKLAGHRLYRRDLKKIIADHLKAHSDELANQIMVDAKDHTKTDFSNDMKLYVQSLLDQWNAENSALKDNTAVIEQNRKCIELVSNALIFINAFENNPDFPNFPYLVSDIYKRLQIEIASYNPIVSTTLSNLDHAIEVSTNISKPRASADAADPDFKFNQFCLKQITTKKESTETELKTTASNLADSGKLVEKEQLALLFSQYLECIRAEWKVGELSNSSKINTEYYTSRDQLISDAITQLKQNPVPPTPPLDIDQILNDFANKLEEKSTRSSDVSARVKYFITKQFASSDQELDKLYSESKNSISEIRSLHDECKSVIEALKSEAEKESKYKEFEDKKAALKPKAEFIEGVELSDDKSARQISISSLLTTYTNAVSDKHPIFSRRHLPKVEVHEEKWRSSMEEYKHGTPGWKSDPVGNISDLAKPSTPGITGNKPHSGLADGKYQDHVNDTLGIRLREARHSNNVHISLVEKPRACTDKTKHYSDQDKTIAYIVSAEEAVRMLVRKCGISEEAPLNIEDNPDKEFMQALIIVCKANNLKFRLPRVSRYGYDFVPDHTTLSDKADFLRDYIEKNERNRKIQMNAIDPAISAQLERDIKQLQDHYTSKYTHGDIKEEDNKQFQAELTKISTLVENAKQGSYSIKAINDALQKLERDKAEIKLEPPERPRRLHR